MNQQITLSRKIGFSNGVIESPKLSFSRRHSVSKKFLESKRGKVRSFSFQSSARLRQKLACFTVPDSILVSACLTLPIHASVSCEEYRSFWKYFQIYIKQNKILSKCGFVWRHELQSHGFKKPHTHFVIYVPNSISYQDFYFAFSDLCEHLIIKFGFCEKTQDFFRVFGLDVSVIDDSGKYIKYLLDHLSKHKQTQLGFIGRQWGVINAKLFVEIKMEDMIEEQCRIMSVRSNAALIHKVCVSFSRSFRRYLSWHCHSGTSPFGFHLLRVRGVPRFVFLSNSAVDYFRRYVNFLIHEYF